MRRDEYQELLQYARERAALAGRDDLDAYELNAEESDRGDDPRDELFRYLGSLRTAARLSSEEAVRAVRERLNEITLHGEIAAISIAIDIRDQEVFGLPDSVELLGNGRAEEAIAMIDRLYEGLASDGEGYSR